MAIYTPYQIKSFKYDGSLHRTWAENWLIPPDHLTPAQRGDGWVVLINDHTKIIEANGKEWVSRVPGIVFFLPNLWYNIVALLETEGIRYYCNLASPFHMRGGVVTYIDYDLDVILRPDKEIVVVDEEEYRIHRGLYRYPDIVVEQVADGLKQLKRRIAEQGEPFDDDVVQGYYLQWRRQFRRG